MAGASDSTTSETLLRRIQRDPTDQEALLKFVNRYGPRIAGWCRQRGLQPADVEDVTEGVLMKLLKRLQTFEYDSAQSFRGYLNRATRNALADFFTQLEGTVRGSGSDDVLEQLRSVEARRDLDERLADAFDLEVWEEARMRVQLRVDAKTWLAFEELALKERPGKEVADELGMTVPAAYMARSRVQQMLKEEVERLSAPDLDETTDP